MNSDFPYVIFETNDFLIFYKPPFWKMDTDSRYNIKNTEDLTKVFNRKIKPLHIFVAIFLNHIYNITVKPPGYNIIHRYDVQTSGGILIAKNPSSFKLLQKAIMDKSSTVKIYVALVNGIIKQKCGFINKNIQTRRY